MKLPGKALLAALALLVATPALAQDVAAPEAAAADTRLSGLIWDTRAARFLSFADVRAAAATAKFVLVGERHGRSAHQNREAFLMGALAADGRRLSVVMEMLNHNQTKVIEAYRIQSPEYVSRLAVPLGWPDSGWPEWNFYEPIFDMAFAAKFPMFGGDLTEAEKDAVEDDVAAPTSEPSTSYYAAQMTRAHCGLIDEARAATLARLQIARDRSMARAMQAAQRPGYGVLLIAGSSHAGRSTGVPAYLPGDDVLTLALVETDGALSGVGPAATPDHGRALPDVDIVWFTPKEASSSLCATLEGLHETEPPE